MDDPLFEKVKVHVTKKKKIRWDTFNKRILKIFLESWFSIHKSEWKEQLFDPRTSWWESDSNLHSG